MGEGLLAIFLAVIGVIGSVFSFLLGKRQEKRSDAQMIIEEYRSLIEDKKIELKDLSDRCAALEDGQAKSQRRINELQASLVLLRAAKYSSPFPSWVKSAYDGRMIDLNPAYENILEMPGERYRGHTDIEVWGEETGTEYWAHDLEVIRTRETWHGFEWILYRGKRERWRVSKWPVFVGDEIVAVEGICIPPLKDTWKPTPPAGSNHVQPKRKRK